MNKELKKKLMSEYAQSASDTGSIELQVALLTGRIQNLTLHFKSNKSDFGSKRGLLKMVSRRKKYLQYLEQKDIDKYRNLIDRLGIRK
jgi:small subunit ribosomal protein S15